MGNNTPNTTTENTNNNTTTTTTNTTTRPNNTYFTRPNNDILYDENNIAMRYKHGALTVKDISLWPADKIDETESDYLRTALIHASVKGDYPIVEALLARGANVNYTDKRGWDALMEAVGYCHFQVVKLLVHHGANLNAKDNAGRTVAYWCAWGGKEEIITFIANKGADLETPSLNGVTPADEARRRNHPENVAKLIENLIEMNRVPVKSANFIA
jgi:ankyrin repeat protein